MPGITIVDVILIVYFVVAMMGLVVLFVIALRKQNQLAKAKETIHTLSNQLNDRTQQLTSVSTHAESDDSPMSKIFDLVDVGFVIIDAGGRVTQCNKTGATLLRKHTHEIVGLPYQQVIEITNQRNEPDYHVIHNALKGESVTRQKRMNLMFSDGTTIPIICTSHALPEGPNQAYTVVFSMLDASSQVTQEANHQAALAALTRELEAAKNDSAKLHQHIEQLEKSGGLEAILTRENPEAVILISVDKTIFHMNASAARITGLYPTDCLGKPYTQTLYFTDTHGQEDHTALDEVFLDKKPKVIKRWTFLTTKNGKTPITGFITPLPDAHGALQGVALQFVDSLSEYQEHVDEKAFFSSAAHDLRAPLTTMRSVIDLLITNYDTTPKDQAKQLLTSANESMNGLIGLVNDLLNVSRIELNRIETKKEVFDLITITNELVDQFRISAQQKHLYMEHPLPDPPVAKVRADRARCTEVLSNLLGNAIKYTIQGGIIVTHEVTDTMVITNITDTGPGIARENERLLFRKFQQVASARSLSGAKSTGLGLYIAKKFANLMGGDVVLKTSEPGKGSTFSLNLPTAT